jgi:acetyltransferase
MPIPTTKRRFDPDRIFAPQSVCLSGAGTESGQKIIRNMRQAGYKGQFTLEAAQNPDLAIIADAPENVAAALHAHAARGARAAIVISDVPELAALAKAAGIRVLGPHSFGMIIPALGLNASTLDLMPAPGRMAMVAQSASLASTVLDWALPNGAGFSQIVSIGGNTDIGFGLVLDHVARDPHTNAILVQIDRLRDTRLFYSAARAAARLRPVVALVPGLRMRDRSGNSHAAFEAAFARAGVLLTFSISEFLAAAETLTRVKPARSETLAIISNSVSAGRLAADYALDHGLKLAQLSDSTAQILALSLGAPPPRGPIFAGREPTKLADLAAMLSAAPEVGGILIVHAPSGGDQNAAIEALIACAQTVKIPLLIAAMGEQTGLGHRHRLAAAGLAAFETPEAAIAGFLQLLRNRRNRAAARELPASKVLTMAPDFCAVTQGIAQARAAGENTIPPGAALDWLAGYRIPIAASARAATPAEAAMAGAKIGFPVVVKFAHPDMPINRLTGSVVFDLHDEAAVEQAAIRIAAHIPKDMQDAGAFVVQRQVTRGIALRIRVADHHVLGPVIGFGAGGGDPDDVAHLACDLPPLNLPLARALIERSAMFSLLQAHRGVPAADIEAVAATLVRVSQMIIDFPDILVLDIDPLFANETGVMATSARIALRESDQKRPVLVISPYPSELISSYQAKGEKFLLRPIRPEDADAHAALFTRFSAEDMRYRFFSAMRHLPPEQIARMTDIDYGREMAIIAVREATGDTAGAARLVRNDTEGTQAEFAVAVEPAAKGLGLATALMRAVIAWGRAQGVRDITGQILADNAPMLAFIKRLGFTLAHVPDEPEIMEAKLEL